MAHQTNRRIRETTQLCNCLGFGCQLWSVSRSIDYFQLLDIAMAHLWSGNLFTTSGMKIITRSAKLYCNLTLVAAISNAIISKSYERNRY